MGSGSDKPTIDIDEIQTQYIHQLAMANIL